MQKKVYLYSGIVLVITFLLDVFVVHHHAHYWWHSFRGFDIIFGFLGCLLIIYFAKSLGKAFIQRDEQYYNGGERGDD